MPAASEGASPRLTTRSKASTGLSPITATNAISNSVSTCSPVTGSVSPSAVVPPAARALLKPTRPGITAPVLSVLTVDWRKGGARLLQVNPIHRSLLQILDEGVVHEENAAFAGSLPLVWRAAGERDHEARLRRCGAGIRAGLARSEPATRAPALHPVIERGQHIGRINRLELLDVDLLALATFQLFGVQRLIAFATASADWSSSPR